ncbi:MAG TPA: hypothetical protein VMF51_24645 [Nocardioides sp.]|uniref:hypothetical protein n=1 Tax=Nocardioides sp. TaxID=35761 RepID=UPI002CFDCA69|nr:hypothetical protein [Nocardioides sp.]HTW18336.1 hypothetical protein [Nocardioides sp.]
MALFADSGKEAFGLDGGNPDATLAAVVESVCEPLRLVYLALAGGGRHESVELAVRIGGGKECFCTDDEGRDGVCAARLGVTLEAGSRFTDRGGSRRTVRHSRIRKSELLTKLT